MPISECENCKFIRDPIDYIIINGERYAQYDPDSTWRLQVFYLYRDNIPVRSLPVYFCSSECESMWIAENLSADWCRDEAPMPRIDGQLIGIRWETDNTEKPTKVKAYVDLIGTTTVLHKTEWLKIHGDGSQQARAVITDAYRWIQEHCDKHAQ